jgi:ATP-dependent DNA helicase PIF1
MHSISHVVGTGKSVLLREIITWARSRHRSDVEERQKTSVAVTASTGMAAVNIGGVTLHSWAGIGFGNGDLKEYVRLISFGSGHWTKVRDRWEGVKTLIIDESDVQFLSPRHTC